MKIEATKNLLAAATSIRLSETEEFFAGHPQSSNAILRAWSAGTIEA